MSATAYDLAVSLSFQAAGVGSAISTMTGLFQALEKQALATGSAVSKMGIVAGVGLTAMGVAGVVAMKSWVDQAAKMQEAITQVGLVAKGTKAQLNDLFNQSFTIAGQTQFSAPTILQMESVMARMGFRDLSGQQTQRQVIGQAIPEFARAAEILFHFQQTDPQTAVQALAQQAHMFGTYSGAALAQNVAYAIGASMSSGMDITQQAMMLRYLMPAQKTLGMTPIDALSLAALESITGLGRGGRGGSNAGALFRYMAPGGSAAHQQGLQAVEQAGGGQFFPGGKNFVGAIPALEIIARFLADPNLTQLQKATDLVNAFKVQGAQAAAVLANPTAIKQLETTRAYIESYTPTKVVGMQQALNATQMGQIATLKTNIQSIEAMLGTALLPTVVAVTHNLVLMTAGLIKFGEQHPTIVKVAAGFTAVATAVGLVAGPLLIILAAVGGAAAGWGLLTAGVTAASIAFGALDAALFPILIPLGAIALAVTGVILLFTHWHDITNLLGDMIGWAAGKLHDFLVFLKLMPGQSQNTHQSAAGASMTPYNVGPSKYNVGSSDSGAGTNTLPGTVVVPPILPVHPAVSHPYPHHHAPPHPRGTGGGSAPTIMVTNHFHGADHQTQEALAARVSKKVVDDVSRAWTHERNFGSTQPYATDLGPLPY